MIVIASKKYKPRSECAAGAAYLALIDIPATKERLSDMAIFLTL